MAGALLSPCGTTRSYQSMPLGLITVLLRSRLKSDRCESASAATCIRPGLCSTVNLYSAKRWDCSQPCVMTHGPYILWKFYCLIDRIWISTERTSWHIVPCRSPDSTAPLVDIAAIENEWRVWHRRYYITVAQNRYQLAEVLNHIK